MTGSKRKPYKINWFKFYPSDLIEIIEMTDAEAGKRIKQFIKNLTQNRAPQGSLEERMLQEAGEFSRRQSERIRNYWNSKKEPTKPEEEPPRERPQRNRPTPRPPKIPPSPVMEQNPEKFR